ncbi:SDR family NAD(P)-dependent oxidoreductase [Streptomyces sp. NPDC001933]|uniref:SDR family NAD(P)-dependent oxidoreductase n=1 Tax=Streptomyces sp. NPDC001933 TaxID=3364626 RepID=UPI0036B5289D
MIRAVPPGFHGSRGRGWQAPPARARTRTPYLRVAPRRRCSVAALFFVSSEAGVQTPTDMVHYGMTRTAQPAVSRGMAQEVAGTGVTVNCVLPGPTMG